MRGVFILTILGTASAALAQTDVHACEPSPELRNFYFSVKGSPERVEKTGAKVEAFPRDLLVNRWYLGSPDMKPGSRSADYQNKLDRHPDDAAYLYLYGLSLMGADTRRAIEYLEEARDKDPLIPWTYWSLMDVYASPVFRDSAKLAENMTSFSDRCPRDPNAYDHIGLVEDKAAARGLAVRYRKAVEGRSSVGVAQYYPRLWTAEFRTGDPKDFEKLRGQVAVDLKRVKELDPKNTRSLMEGDKLIGDQAAVKALEGEPAGKARAPRFFDVFQAWNKEHPWPKEGTAEAKERFYEERLTASAQWVKDFPEETNALYWRMISFSQMSAPDRAAVEKAGEAVLECDARHKPAWTIGPYSLHVAEAWNQLNIRPADCFRLAMQAIEELDRKPKSDNDMLRAPGIPTGSGFDYNSARSRFDAWSVAADASRKLGNLDQARSITNEMKSWLDNHKGDNRWLEAQYFGQMGNLAQAEGHKLDALAYYQPSLIQMSRDKEMKARARSLWKELGGDDRTFDLWLKAPEPQKPMEVKTVWTALNKPLGLNAADLAGKMWTVAGLKGKTTLINVWATWCEPCREELPFVQKLYEGTKGRSDVQVITINVDANPGLAGTFVQENRYTFPVVLDKALVDKLVPEMAIPRNWIVDSAGTLRMESVGFVRTDWPEQILRTLSAEIK